MSTSAETEYILKHDFGARAWFVAKNVHQMTKNALLIKLLSRAKSSLIFADVGHDILIILDW